MPPLPGQLPAFPVSWWLSTSSACRGEGGTQKALLWRARALAAQVQLCSPPSLGAAAMASPTGSALHRPSGRRRTRAR